MFNGKNGLFNIGKIGEIMWFEFQKKKKKGKLDSSAFRRTEWYFKDIHINTHPNRFFTFTCIPKTESYWKECSMAAKYINKKANEASPEFCFLL